MILNENLTIKYNSLDVQSNSFVFYGGTRQVISKATNFHYKYLNFADAEAGVVGVRGFWKADFNGFIFIGHSKVFGLSWASVKN